MGMAASQARFLGLTARRNNVEYEGQQINQQRTALANQSANYYNDLLGMSVPTPPSVDAFTKTVYTFNDGALTNSITSLIATGGGAYTVSYLQQYDDEFAVVADGYGVTTKNNGVYSVGNNELKNIAPTVPIKVTIKDNGQTYTDYELGYDEQQQKYRITNNNGRTWVYPSANYTIDSVNGSDYLKNKTLADLYEIAENTTAEEALWIQQLNAEYGTPKNGWAIRYVENTSTGHMEPKFYNLDEVLDSADFTSANGVYDSATGNSLSQIQVYTIGTKTKTNEIKGVNANIETDTTGRLINITLNPNSANEVTHALTTNTITDQQAYDDAMNQYEYEKHKYDQAIEEINAKIEIIQAEDKNLELRLKQLDTEHDAISNEMEAVQKVIEQNTQTSFKTFG